MSTTTMHAYTVPENLIPGHLHPNTQRKYREVLRKFQVTRETTWPDVLAAVNAVANINTRRTCVMVRNPLRGSIDYRYPMNKHPGPGLERAFTSGHSGRCALGCAAAAVGSEGHPGPDREDQGRVSRTASGSNGGVPRPLARKTPPLLDPRE